MNALSSSILASSGSFILVVKLPLSVLIRSTRSSSSETSTSSLENASRVAVRKWAFPVSHRLSRKFTEENGLNSRKMLEIGEGNGNGKSVNGCHRSVEGQQGSSKTLEPRRLLIGMIDIFIRKKLEGKVRNSELVCEVRHGGWRF
ncbi:hypothetical protein FF2_006075 [Malus domestica]